jgi:hypothetical protein
MNYRGDPVPKIPSVGDIYIFDYACSLNFAAKVTKVTDKSVSFHRVKINTLKKDTSNVLESYYCWVPLDELVEDTDHKFTARKTSFRENGDVEVTHKRAYGQKWDGKPVETRHYH